VGSLYRAFRGAAARLRWLEQIDPLIASGRGRVEARSSRRTRRWTSSYRIRGAGGAHRWFKVRACRCATPKVAVVKWFRHQHGFDDQKRATNSSSKRIQERTAQLQAAFPPGGAALPPIAHVSAPPIGTCGALAQLLLLGHADRLDDKARDYLNRINKTAARSDELIRDLLEYGRLSHEAVSLAPVDSPPDRPGRCCERWRGKSSSAMRMFTSAGRSGRMWWRMTLARANLDQFREQRPPLRAARPGAGDSHIR